MNWTALIHDLHATGLNNRQIAEQCSANLKDEISPSTIKELEKGRTRDPRFSLGTELVSLHIGRCRSKRRSAKAN